MKIATLYEYQIYSNGKYYKIFNLIESKDEYHK